MSEEKRVWGVLFTDAGLNEIGAALEPYLSTGSIGAYLYCKHVDIGQPFCRLIADHYDEAGSAFEAEIYVPYQHIKFIIAGLQRAIAPERRIIGF